MVSLNQLLATKSPGELSALAERLDYMADAKVVGPLKAAAVTTKGGAGAKAAAAGSAAKSAAVGADATGSKAGLAAGSIWSGKRFGLDLAAWGSGLGGRSCWVRPAWRQSTAWSGCAGPERRRTKACWSRP